MEMMQAEVAPNVAIEGLRRYPGGDAPCHLSSPGRGGLA